MKPAYFGSPSRPLFGIHELPRAREGRDRAVLLCYPGVQEYNMAHWAFRRLSAMLSREGFHVMRFDWSGTGDSWGETVDQTPDACVRDVGYAVQELRDASGTRRLSIVGFRLGAALAAIACAGDTLADELVLWDPVVEGRRYVTELEELDARENERLLYRLPEQRAELVGFPFPHSLRASIEGIDLLAAPPPRVKRAVLIVGSDTNRYRRLEHKLTQAGVHTAFRHVPEDAAETNAGLGEAALLATRSLAAVVDQFRGGALT